MGARSLTQVPSTGFPGVAHGCGFPTSVSDRISQACVAMANNLPISVILSQQKCVSPSGHLPLVNGASPCHRDIPSEAAEALLSVVPGTAQIAKKKVIPPAQKQF